MKTPQTICILLGLALSGVTARAETAAEARQRQALDILRQTISEQRQQAAAKPGKKEPTLAEMQRKYLEGKINARDYEKFVRSHPAQPANPLVVPAPQSPSPAAVVNKEPAPAVATKAVAPAAPADKAARTKAIAEAEAKLEELAALKAAREKEATNGPAPAPAPKTKRDRLDEVLRLFVGGKISEDEYKEQRSKILAEPN